MGNYALADGNYVLLYGHTGDEALPGLPETGSTTSTATPGDEALPGLPGDLFLTVQCYQCKYDFAPPPTPPGAMRLLVGVAAPFLFCLLSLCACVCVCVLGG
jgi:hypothetical protein